MANTTGKKFGGRKQGTPNAVTGDLRTWLTTFLQEQREQLQTDWKHLKPAQRIALFEKLLRYCLPQLQNTEFKTDFDKLDDEQLNTIINELKNGQRS